MTTTTRYRLYDAEGAHIAACKHPEDAAALISIQGEGATIRLGRSAVLWTEGSESWRASESFDRTAAQIVTREENACASRATTHPLRAGTRRQTSTATSTLTSSVEHLIPSALLSTRTSLGAGSPPVPTTSTTTSTPSEESPMPVPPPVQIQIPTSTSSVEIQSRAKGAPQITVHVYWSGSEHATRSSLQAVSQIAQDEYDALMAKYAAEVA